MVFTKLLGSLMVTGLLAGAAVPAVAHSPRPRVHIGLDLGNVRVVVGRPAPMPQRVRRVDYALLERGVHMEREGQALIAEGRDLQWRGERAHKRGWLKRGVRLEERGHDLVREGRRLQYEARDRWATIYHSH